MIKERRYHLQVSHLVTIPPPPSPSQLMHEPPPQNPNVQDRAHRIGQKHEVRVFRLVTDSPVEERIISRATDKLNMTGLVVEAGKFNRDSKAAERK